MNLGDRKGLDRLLDQWPAPPSGALAKEQNDEQRLEERADAIVRAALGGSKASAETLDALLEAPALAPEPGESSAALPPGEKKMADDEKVDERKPDPVATPSAPPPERKRTSLKEMAARASQSGGRASVPSGPPSNGPPSGRGSSPGIAAPAPRAAASTPIPRAVEAGKDDSGVINLHVVHATATAQQVAAAEKAKPGQAGLFEDEKTTESAVNPAQKQPVSKVPHVAVVAAKKSNTGAMAGVAIAVFGIAAAFAIIRQKQVAAPAHVAAEDRGAAQATPAPAATAAPVAVATTQATSEATAVASAQQAPAASGEADSKGADTAKRAVAVAPVTGGPSGATPGPSAKDDAQVAAKAAAATGKPGDLQAEMARAVGPVKEGKAADDAPTPEPAAGSRNQNVPEQPSQGSVQAAVNGVIAGAKGCVAGADDVSRASITFSSGGNVTSVSVSGWAAAHGKSGCVQAALKGAKVGPFSKPSYVVAVPIRP